MLICDLIDAIKPGSIQYNLLKTSGTPEVSCVDEPRSFSTPCLSGKDGQRALRDLHGQKDRRPHLRSAGRHRRNETENAPDWVRLSHGKRSARTEELTGTRFLSHLSRWHIPLTRIVTRSTLVHLRGFYTFLIFIRARFDLTFFFSHHRTYKINQNERSSEVLQAWHTLHAHALRFCDSKFSVYCSSYFYLSMYPREKGLLFCHGEKMSSTFIPIQSSISSIQILGDRLSTRYIVDHTPGVSYCWHSRWPIVEMLGIDRSSRAKVISRYGSMSAATNVSRIVRIVIVLVGVVQQFSWMMLNNVLLMLSRSIFLVDSLSVACVRVNNHLFDHLRWLVVGVENMRFLRMERVPPRGTRADVPVGVLVVQSPCFVRMVSRSSIVRQAG